MKTSADMTTRKPMVQIRLEAKDEGGATGANGTSAISGFRAPSFAFVDI